MDSSYDPAGGVDEGFLADFKGPGLVCLADGTVAKANTKGASLASLMGQGLTDDLVNLMHQARTLGQVTVGEQILRGSKGDIVLEVTVVPLDGDGTCAVLARDTTMDRNLRTALVESRQRYKDLVEISSDFSWEVGLDGAFVFVSPRGAIGYAADELVGRQPADFVLDPDDYAPLPFTSPLQMDDVEMWMRRADGGLSCVLASCRPLLDADGTWRGTRGSCRDVTREREREAELNRARTREQVLNYVVRTIRDEVQPLDMLTTAAQATARSVGAAGCRIYRDAGHGRFEIAAQYGSDSKSDALDSLSQVFRQDSQVQEISVGGWRVLAAATRYHGESNGGLCLWKTGDQGAWDADHHLIVGDVANQLGIANQQVANHEHILTLSRTDGMTGLLNRRAFFEEELPRRIGRLRHNGKTSALFYVDMDNFKRVNDVHGHQAGDEAILALCEMLRKLSRPGDLMARLGGDEFAIWLDGVSAEVAEQRAAAVIEASAALRRFSGDSEHPLGVSLGVALYDPVTGENLEELLMRADEAMYAIKNAGKGGYILAQPPGRPPSPDGGS